MKIAILTLGTRGDVQPFLALGKGLQAAGHEVVLCTSERFGGWIRAHGLRYGYLSDEMLALMSTDRMRAASEAGGGPLGWLRSAQATAQQFRPVLRRLLAQEWEAARGADAVIYHPKAIGGYHIAERLGVPGFAGLVVPVLVPTGDFPMLLFPNPGLGRSFNRLTYRFVPLMSVAYAGVVNAWRRDALRLPPHPPWRGELVRADGRPVPVLHAYSPHVVQPPQDWPEQAVTTGFWFLDEAQAWRPPAALEAFLTAGPPPVYVGFGSMVGREPARLTQIVLDAVARAGQRAVLASGWGGLAAADLPPGVFALEEAPHAWLFPRMAAVVHHGGAGTTAAGLRAGRPTVICPVLADQPFWGRRVAALEAGPSPLPQRTLTAEALARAIRAAVEEPRIRSAAARLGERIRAEDGVARAVESIEAHLREEAVRRTGGTPPAVG